jgi:hypothetical protein
MQDRAGHVDALLALRKSLVVRDISTPQVPASSLRSGTLVPRLRRVTNSASPAAEKSTISPNGRSMPNGRRAE